MEAAVAEVAIRGITWFCLNKLLDITFFPFYGKTLKI
jgi:hypothetical protein